MVKAATYNIYSKLLGECSVKTRLPSHGRSLRERESWLYVQIEIEDIVKSSVRRGQCV